MAGTDRGGIEVKYASYIDPNIPLYELKKFKESSGWRAILNAIDKLIQDRQEEAAAAPSDQAIGADALIRVVSLASGGVIALEQLRGMLDVRISHLENEIRLKNQEGEEHGTPTG